ncbi:hypothetical protein K469DRAFT_809343 [Zopfia rhizophila CBS 207.26]|uniref:Uncharacterized protein n=1 Tax=Zopfia rhizophila CBS 207.26 TaxID=1314779 RepID=A0A6A6DCX8_9PEZI|nr:hypothetical protein K469DRAFT_809343 [Zopfia rhizophila CBS 207.26]
MFLPSSSSLTLQQYSHTPHASSPDTQSQDRKPRSGHLILNLQRRISPTCLNQNLNQDIPARGTMYIEENFFGIGVGAASCSITTQCWDRALRRICQQLFPQSFNILTGEWRRLVASRLLKEMREKERLHGGLDQNIRGFLIPNVAQSHPMPWCVCCRERAARIERRVGSHNTSPRKLSFRRPAHSLVVLGYGYRIQMLDQQSRQLFTTFSQSLVLRNESIQL